MVCFLHGKTWEEYCAKIATTLEPSLDSYSSALGGRNGLDDLIGDDDGDAFVVADALAKSGDNLESVSKNNQSCKAEEEVKSSEAAEGKSSEDVINELVEDVVLNAATQAASSENGDSGGKQVEG